MKSQKKIDCIHFLGKSGAGKTACIKKYFQNFDIFDIKDIYDRYHFSTTDLKDLNKRILYERALQVTLDAYFTENHKNQKPLVVESSGINGSLNNILGRYITYSIYIKREIPESIYLQRSYARGLNERIEDRYNKRTLVIDELIDLDSDTDVVERAFQKVFSTINLHPEEED